jgi:hypothetical protein
VFTHQLSAVFFGWHFDLLFRGHGSTGLAWERSHQLLSDALVEDFLDGEWDYRFVLAAKWAVE